jgi:hypothetical protein
MTHLVERRRPAVNAELLRRVGLVFGLIAFLLIVIKIPAIRELRFPGPDDTLRMVEVRDLIAGQGWFDLHMHHVDAIHGGVPMHWSRLVDIPLAAVILLLRPLLGQPHAELAAMIFVPLVTFGFAIFLAGRIAWRLLNEEATTFACLALALSVPVVSQMQPLRVDHHGWQIVAALAAVNGLMARTPRIGGWIIGLSLAVWLSISVEGLPMSVVIVGITALRWLRREEDKIWLVTTMQTLAGGSVVLFLATRGFADLAIHCDQISPVHLAIFGWGALALTGLGALGPHPRTFTLLGFGVAGLGAAELVLFAAPQCAGGGFVTLDPLVRTYWYNNVAEGLPVWHQPIKDMLQVVVPPAVGLWASFNLARRSQDWLRRWWIEYTLLLAAALAVAVFVTRAGAVAGALAAIPLGWQITKWIRAARNLRRPGRRALALVGVGVVLVPAMPATLLAMAMPAEAKMVGDTPPGMSSCHIQLAAPALRRLPAGEILAPLDIGPDLVYQTPLTVVATGHHRGAKAMHEVIAAFTGSPEHAHAVVRARGTSYVAMCPDLAEPSIYVHHAPNGFAAQLLKGEVPDWLEPIAMAPGVDFKIWKVKD